MVNDDFEFDSAVEDNEEIEEQERSVRQSYQHDVCGSVTAMSLPLAEAFAQDPKAYDVVYCGKCQDHHNVNEFVWLEDGNATDKKVGS